MYQTLFQYDLETDKKLNRLIDNIHRGMSPSELSPEDRDLLYRWSRSSNQQGSSTTDIQNTRDVKAFLGEYDQYIKDETNRKFLQHAPLQGGNYGSTPYNGLYRQNMPGGGYSLSSNPSYSVPLNPDGSAVISNLGDNAGRVLGPIDGSQFNDSGRNEQIASQSAAIPNKQKYYNYLYSLTPQVQSIQQSRDPARATAFNNMLRSSNYGNLNVSDSLIEHDVFNPGFTGQAPTREAFDTSIQTGAETAGHEVTQGEKDNAWNFYGNVQRNKVSTSTLNPNKRAAYMNFIRGSVY